MTNTATTPSPAPRDPTQAQIFFAECWPGKLWLMLGAVAGAAWAVTESEVSAETLSWPGVLWLAFALPLAMGAGFLFAIISLCCAAPFYFVRARLNGAPFQPGDIVQVLAKPHRGAAARVIHVTEDGPPWIELDLSTAEDATPVSNRFAPFQLQRISPRSRRGRADVDNAFRAER